MRHQESGEKGKIFSERSSPYGEKEGDSRRTVFAGLAECRRGAARRACCRGVDELDVRRGDEPSAACAVGDLDPPGSIIFFQHMHDALG